MVVGAVVVVVEVVVVVGTVVVVVVVLRVVVVVLRVVVVVVVVVAVVVDRVVGSRGRGTLFLGFEFWTRAGTLGMGLGFLTGATLFSNLGWKRESKSFN